MTTEFYKDLEIFVTGGSGVVGKAAIEKLLRSCDVKKIYVLLRSKKGVKAEDRLEEMKNAKIFKVLKECKPNELNKLIAIPGDTALDGLGISPEHREMIKNVSVFFHSAATTRFDEPLKKAIRVNLKSTMEGLKIAETLENLKVFIHVSTFFSNPYLDYIEDKIYPALFDWKIALKILDSDSDKMDPILQALTEKVISGFLNTYLFTKHLAEQLVNDYRHKLPVGIYRPSIVVAALEEPEPGFTEAITGVMGLLCISGTGLIKVLSCQRENKIEFAPLDIIIKALLIFTARTAKLQKEKFIEAVPVSKFASDGLHNFSFGQMLDLTSKALIKNPYEKSVWIPGLKLTDSTFVYIIYNFFLQLLPSFLIDFLLRLFGQAPFMMNIQRRIYMTAKVLDFFTKKEYHSDGATDLEEFLRIENGTAFDMKSVVNCCKGEEDLDATATIMCSGCRKFIMNEDESSLPRSRKILKWKIIAYNIIRCYMLYVVGCAIYKRFMAYLSG